MAAVHTKTGVCLWPAHIYKMLTATNITIWRVVYQDTGSVTLGTVRPAENFATQPLAQAAADAYLTQVGPPP